MTAHLAADLAGWWQRAWPLAAGGLAAGATRALAGGLDMSRGACRACVAILVQCWLSTSP
eukprot:1202113-Prymnesium_polylepis.1